MIRPEARDVNIFKAVVVVIADSRAHAPANVGDSGFGGDLGELSVPLVAIEFALRLSFDLHQIDRKRVDEVDVEIAVVVVIDEGYAATHRLDDVALFRRGDVFECDSGGGSDVGECDLR